jgi:hypothetical protein
MSEDFNARLNLVLKSEKALLKLEIRKRGRQTVLIVIALLAVLTGLVMLNITAYLYFITLFSNLVAAALLTGINLLLAVLFFVLAIRQDTGAETESIQEIRDFAWQQLSTDIDGVKAQVTELTDGVKRVSRGVDSVVHMDFFGLKTLLPLFQSLSRRKKKKKITKQS